MQLSDQAQVNYSILRDCIADPLTLRSADNTSNNGKRRSKNRKKSIEKHVGAQIDSMVNSDAEDLAEFIDVQPPWQSRLPR